MTMGRPGYGFIGYGITMYKPLCAYSCRSAISHPLQCSTMDMSMPDMNMWETSPECHASDDIFLQTLAYCMSTRCQDVDVWRLERYWKLNVAGRLTHQPLPKYSYQEALARVKGPPNSTIPTTERLDAVSLVTEEAYVADWNAMGVFEVMEKRYSTYGLVLLLSGSLLPIAFSLLRFLPFPRHLTSRFAAIFVYPPLYGFRTRVPPPTRGQAFLIFYFFSINTILSFVGYRTAWPNSWWGWHSQQIVTYIANRTGVLSSANIALLTLYAGRNNFLLWVTNWSHSTFLLLHQWIAVFAVIQACLHSAIYLGIYLDPRNGEPHSSESKLAYWVWGIVATLAMVLLLPLSISQIRRRAYEVFLASHFVLALLAYISYYYHIICRFGRQWGYETWIYIAFGIWAFDRLVRTMKLARNGIKTGHVTIVDDDYVRLDVPGVAAAGHAYLYFPTLTWRVWENHPFSVVCGSLPRTSRDTVNCKSASGPALKLSDSREVKDVSIDLSPERRVHRFEAGAEVHPSVGIGLSFFVRIHKGITCHLRSRKTLPVLVEGPYAASYGGIDMSAYPNILCIAGGVGITAVVDVLSKYSANRPKLYWGVRSNTGLVDAMRDKLESLRTTGVDIEVRQGDRVALEEVIVREIEAVGSANGGVVIMVSGPPSMSEEARRVVARVASQAKAAVVAFHEESFSW